MEYSFLNNYSMISGIYIAALAAMALAPGLFWLWYFIRKGRTGRGARLPLVRLFFAGALVMPAAILLEKPAGGSMLILLVAAAPVIEESMKLAAVKTALLRRDAHPGPMDGIVCAVTAALGFASAENIYTMVASYLAPQLALGLSDPMWALGMIWRLYLVRALLTVPGHALWSAMWGYALGAAEKSPGGRGRYNVIRAWTLAVVLHGLFNLMLINFPPGALGMLVLVPVTWRLVYRRIERARLCE